MCSRGATAFGLLGRVLGSKGPPENYRLFAFLPRELSARVLGLSQFGVRLGGLFRLRV